MDFDVPLGLEQPGATTGSTFDFDPKSENRRLVAEQAFGLRFDGATGGFVKIEVNTTEEKLRAIRGNRRDRIGKDRRDHIFEGFRIIAAQSERHAERDVR